MQYAVNSSQMKFLDQTTIQKIGIPSMVLMERAAYEFSKAVCSRATHHDKILTVCGVGNNGGDGIAIARILTGYGYAVDILIVGDQNKMTMETKQQLDIAMNLGLSIRTETNFTEYTIIIDSIFGIGLSKPVQGLHADIIRSINEQSGRAYIIAVDIPSGISADHGQILGIGVKADETITFEELKLGLLLYPGAEYAGRITVAKIGICTLKQSSELNDAYLYCEPCDLKRLLPKRPAYANKGTFGKVLVIAGSSKVTGAAFLSAYAAYRMGVGLVKVLTARNAIPVLQQLLPEAVFGAYDDENWEEELAKSITFADSVVLGPGIGTDAHAFSLFFKAIELLKYKECETPLVIDADALNILSTSLDSDSVNKAERYHKISNLLPRKSILTPHLMEFSRLSLEAVNNIPSILIDIARECTYNNELIYVLKDTRTIVSSQNRKVINTSGNNGMATGGSGDALTGVIAALLARGLLREDAAMLGVYVHGLAGDLASIKLGANSVLARDIIEALPEVLMNYDGK